MLRKVATLRARAVAFAMGLHARLGAASLLAALEPELARAIAARGV